ncbi:MAG: hypothetical protein HZA01_16390 [Nitrospinae bacterium]|nr:hypothetical protein [Nitrospinota bacterium]
MKTINSLILLGLSLIIFSCADSLPTNTNKPFAVAGPDKTAAVGQTIILDATGSYDVKRSDLDYSWQFSNIPPVPKSKLKNSSLKPLNKEGSVVEFTPDAAGNYNLALTVKNNKASDTDYLTVTVSGGGTNKEPIASAGADQTVPVRTEVTLDGSNSADPEGKSLVYSWSFAKAPPVSGSSLKNSSFKNISSNGSIVTFTPDAVGSYVAKLTVKDPDRASASDLVIIKAENTKPAANAGADQTTTAGTSVILDATGSSDANGDTLTYSWSFAAVPPVTGSGLTNSSLTAKTSDKSVVEFKPDVTGNFVVELTVSDGTLSDTDSIVVVVK